MSLYDDLVSKVKVLNETIWEDRATRRRVDDWLNNFDDSRVPSERMHALYLLSRFMYFGDRELRALLRALYRDLYQPPVIRAIRRRHGNTTDLSIIEHSFAIALQNTRFLGVGNPSDSGAHLLYYFRQENQLSRMSFAHAHELFHRYDAKDARLKWPAVTRYVFLDDFCGSGSQVARFCKSVVAGIRKRNKRAHIAYYMLFGRKEGISHLRNMFDDVQALFELDGTYKSFVADSRYFIDSPLGIDRSFAESMARAHGDRLWSEHPMGFDDGQLLIGFHHNTPDNTLPIIWNDEATSGWTPIFRRYPKHYGWGGGGK
jgi:hypothetical protein